jgi:hypothetical protein
MSHCLAIDRNTEGCRRDKSCESRFCNFHQYMNDYSDEMLANQTICSGCKKAHYLEDGRKICNGCRERSKLNVVKNREKVVLCGKSGCKFKKSKENNYCNKHQLCIFEDETKAMNKKLCYNVIRSCRSQMEMDYKFSKCPDCLEIERAKDHKRRNKAKQQYIENVIENSIRECKLCTVCCIERPMEMFIGVATTETKTCKMCRDGNKTQDMKRDKEHRNELARTNIHDKYYRYIKSCGERCLEFRLTFDEFVNIVNNHCFYCGYKNSDFVNGIDRKNSSIGYILDNCVTSCKMCNYMKGSLSVDVFIKRVEHILTNQNRINGNLYPECFSNHKCLPYYRYKSRALEKQLDFSITNEDYENIIQNDCFLCGKQSDENNTNGIDRMDNNKGYVLDNINACCGECNFMKNVWEYHEFINKLVVIYEKNRMNSEENIVNEENKEFVLENNIIPKNKTKNSIEEIREANRIYKQRQRDKLKEKYGDEEYKKIRAKEIASYRAGASCSNA